MDDDLLVASSATFGNAFVLVQHLTRLTDARLEGWGLTTRQWLLLAVLVRGFEGRVPSLSEAAAAYGTSRQNVKQIALALEERGFLHLESDPHDGRTTRLRLTDRVGIFDTPEGRRRGTELLEVAFDGLARDEVLALGTLLARWLDALRSTGSTTPVPIPAVANDAAGPAAATPRSRPGKARSTR
jgi:DNA-binding MarR family transcriptional regulator